MYVVKEPINVRLESGRTVYLAPGPRGVKEIRKGPNKPVVGTVDHDAALRRMVPADVLDRLINEGKITVEG